MRALGIYILIILFLYGSFFLVEAGVADIRGNKPEYRALSVSVEEKIVSIIFAGDLYEIDTELIYNYLSELIESIRKHL